MPIYHDLQLDELAFKKCDLGARPEIKKHADQIRVTGDSDVIIRTWQEAAEAGAILESYNLTFVRIPQALALFNRPISEVWPLIQSVQPKVKGKVTSKTLAKMVALRINHLLKEIQVANVSAARHYEFVLKNPAAYGGKAAVPPVPHEFLGDVDSVSRLEAEFDRWGKTQGWGQDRWLKQLRKELLNKPELTDQDVKDGYNMVLAGQVMED